MFNMPAAPLYGAFLAFIYIALSFLVTLHRRSQRISLGDDNDVTLQKKVRAHANFIEYVPFSLLLIWFLETVTYASNLAHILGAMLVVSRVLHAYGILGHQALIYRVWGMWLTYIVIIVAALRILWHAIPL